MPAEASPFERRTRTKGALLYAKYLGVLAIFGTVVLFFNFVCAFANLFGPRHFIAHLAHKLFVALARYMICIAERARIGRIVFEGFERLENGAPTLLVANHTGLLDAVFLMAQLPDADCVFKSRLRRHPLFCFSVRNGRFLSNSEGIDLLRDLAKRIHNGRSTLIFPEGTRTDTPPVNPFKGGFAIVAVRTNTPVQALVVDNPSRLTGKGHSLLRPRALPFLYRFQVGATFHPMPGETARAFAMRVETYFRESLSRAGNSVASISTSSSARHISA